MTLDVSPMRDLMLAYFEGRGSKLPVITTGEKGIEEARELVEAIAAGDREKVLDEAADLALVAVVVANQYGSTIEEAIRAKGERDRDRGEPKHDPTRVEVDQATFDEDHAHEHGGHYIGDDCERPT